MEIAFPRQATLEDNADRIVLECCRALSSQETVSFDLGGIQWVDPFFISILTGTIVQIKKKGLNPTYIKPSVAAVDDFLSQIGFYRYFLLPDPGVHRDSSHELRQLMAFDYTYIENLVNFLASKLPKIKDSLTMSLQEIIMNVLDHSKSKIGCFVCAQYYPGKQLVQLSIADFGVGILKTLQSKYSVTKDVDAILQATKEGVSSRPQKAGLGLAHIRKFVKMNEGGLTIISGNGRVDFSTNRPAKYTLPGEFSGTIVTMDINTTKSGYHRIDDDEGVIF